MAPLLFTIGGAVMNALVFSGTIFSLASLQIKVKSNARYMIWHLKSFRGLEVKAIAIKWNDLISLIKVCIKIMKQEYTSAMLMIQCFNISEKLRTIIKTKMELWPHILCTSTPKKWQMKN